MEILFPAGSLKHIDIALQTGADAVYGGFKQWNARDKANNFTFVKYNKSLTKLHKHNIKFYLTLNTLMFDNDIAEIINVFKTSKAKLPDAFIATDVGLITTLKEEFSQVPIHLSTQFGVHNSDDIGMAKSLGAERVVLSRELTKDKVKEITETAGIETECFVYGSQCISFSGQCYFSSLMNGGSGNRGKCEIFCRDNYSVNSNVGNLLYVPDLDCSKAIADLPSVSSWKLEGRKRDPKQVGQFVRSLKTNNLSANQTGYMYGTKVEQNNLFNQKHIRSVPLLHSSKYDINGNNISFDIKSNNGFIYEITYIDDQGQGTKISSISPCEFIDFDLDHFIEAVKSKSDKNIHKINCNESVGQMYIGRNVQKKIMDKIKRTEHNVNSIIIPDGEIWIELDNLQYLQQLSQEHPDKTFIYNISSVKKLMSFQPTNSKNIIYKLPMFNFDNQNLAECYKKFQNQRIMFTHIGQINLFAKIGLSEKIADYTIPVWNKKTLSFLLKQGIDTFTPSPELLFEQNEQIFGNVNKNYVLYGRLPLVYTRMCFRHLFGCNACNYESYKEILNVDKNINFDIKCYDDHRVILSKTPILNAYPQYGSHTTYRIVTAGISIDEITKILQNKQVMLQNSYSCNMHISRR